MHDRLEKWVFDIDPHLLSSTSIVLFVVGFLATDVFLPIPSSCISTLAGGHLPAWGATAASWIGLTLGAVLGFAVARRWGRPLAERLAGPNDLARMEAYRDRYSTTALVFTRAVPILAEACVLMYGVQGLRWRQFLPPVLLSNLGIAIAYSLFGHYAAAHQWLPIALSISATLPLFFALLIRRRESLRHESP